MRKTSLLRPAPMPPMNVGLDGADSVAMVVVAIAARPRRVRQAVTAVPTTAPVDRAAGRRAGDAAPAISPDGQTIAYAAGRSVSSARLYCARSTALPPRRRSGAAATIRSFPTVSSSRSSRAASLEGARRRRRRDVARVGPMAWGGTGRDGTIVYVPGLNTGLWRVSPDGGKAEQLTQPMMRRKGTRTPSRRRCRAGTCWSRSGGARSTRPSCRRARRRGARPRRMAGIHARRGRQSGHLLWDSASNLKTVAWTPTRPCHVQPKRSSSIPSTGFPEPRRSWCACRRPGRWCRCRAIPTAGIWSGSSAGRRHDCRVTLSRSRMRACRATAYRASTNGRLSVGPRSRPGDETRITSDLKTGPVDGCRATIGIVISSTRPGLGSLFDSRGGGEMTPLLKRPRAQHPLAWRQTGRSCSSTRTSPRK